MNAAFLRMRCRALLVAATLAGGCTFLEPQPDTTRFYVLAALAEPAPEAPKSPALGIGPVQLPAYLGRFEMAYRSTTTEVRYVQGERWAEPLDEGVARVLSENVAALLGSDRVVVLPSLRRTDLDLEVPVEVLRFEPTADGQVTLVARWSVRDLATRRVLDSHESRIREPLEGDSGASRTNAMSRATLRLAEEIAAAVAAVPR